MQKQFNKNFGIIPSIKEEQIAFCNRVNNFLRTLRYDSISDENNYYALFWTVCADLGLDSHKIIDKYTTFLGRPVIPELYKILPKNFINALKIVIAVRRYYKQDTLMVKYIDKAIEAILNLSTVELGISYKSGMFYPKGEELLDHELIEYSLSSLSSYHNEDKDLRNALENYRAGSKYGVIENCYCCIEGLTRQILNNKGTLIDNKPEIIKSSGLSDHWKKILANYIEYGNEYGRHASENRHDFNQSEVEAYLYMTCVLIRLLIIIKNGS